MDFWTFSEIFPIGLDKSTLWHKNCCVGRFIMMMFDSSLGIDFGQNHLILTFLKRTLGKVKMVDYGIHPILPESQKEEREAQVISLVNSFISKHQIHKERTSVSLPREKVVVRFIKLPAATKENLRKVLEYESPRYTPFEKGETYLDYQILKEEKEWLHLFAVFVRKADVDACLSLLKKIGIQPLSIEIPSTGAFNLFSYNEGAKEGEPSLLLDVADPFYEMSLIQERNLTESFHLPLPSDERGAKMISTLKRSGLRGDSLSKSTLFVYGLGADEGMLASLREANQIKEVSYPPLNRIEAGKELSKLYKIYGPLGVALKGLTKTRLDLNLLPFEMRKKVRQIGKPLFIMLTSLAIVLSFAWGMGTFVRYRKEIRLINNEMKKKKPAVDVVEKLQRQKEDLKKEISELEKIRSGEVSKIEMLKELTQVLPSTVWIWNLKYTGKEIEISGFADSASDLIPLLDRSPLFERVEFLTPVTKERTAMGIETKEKERFKIKMRFEGRRVES
jgi:Tfp pilus assembly protein PilN